MACVACVRPSNKQAVKLPLPVLKGQDNKAQGETLGLGVDG